MPIRNKQVNTKENMTKKQIICRKRILRAEKDKNNRLKITLICCFYLYVIELIFPNNKKSYQNYFFSTAHSKKYIICYTVISTDTCVALFADFFILASTDSLVTASKAPNLTGFPTFQSGSAFLAASKNACWYARS